MRIIVNKNGDYDILDCVAAIRAFALRKVKNSFGYECMRRLNKFAIYILDDPELQRMIDKHHFSEFLIIPVDEIRKYRRNVPKNYSIIYSQDERWLVDIIGELYIRVKGYQYKNILFTNLFISSDLADYFSL